jgi:hypothetical protein
VKRLLALVVGAFGLRAYLRRRRRAAEPADELREKLAAQRSVAPEASPAPVEEPEPVPPPAPAEQPVPAQKPATGDVEARRADVHARARQKIDELSG